MAYFLDLCQASSLDSGPLGEEHILNTIEEERK